MVLSFESKRRERLFTDSCLHSSSSSRSSSTAVLVGVPLLLLLAANIEWGVKYA